MSEPDATEPENLEPQSSDSAPEPSSEAPAEDASVSGRDPDATEQEDPDEFFAPLKPIEHTDQAQVAETEPGPVSAIKHAHSLFSLLGRTLGALVIFASLFLLALVAVLWQPPEFVLAWLSSYIERMTLEQTGLPIQIGRISLVEIRPLAQHIELQNVTVYGYKQAHQPFLVAPDLSIDTDLVSLLLNLPQVTLIHLNSPQLMVVRDKSGLINFRPEFPPPDPKAKPQALNLPRAKLIISQLVMKLRNESNDYKIASRIHVPFLDADLHDNKLTDVYGKLRSDFFTFWCKSRIELEKGMGWGSGRLTSVDLDRINPYTHVKDLRIRQGAFQGNLWANWDDFSMRNLRYSGKLMLDHVLAEVPYYSRPVITTGLALINEKRIEISRLQFETDGSVLQSHGWLYDYLKNPSLDLSVTSPHLDIAAVLHSLKQKEVAPLLAMKPKDLAQILNMNPQGLLLANLRVRGPLNPPEKIRYSGKVSLPTFRMQQLAMQGVSADLDFYNNRLKSQIQLAGAQWQDLSLKQGVADIDYRLSNNHLQGIVHLGESGWRDARLYDSRAIVDYQGKQNRFKGEVWVNSGKYQAMRLTHARGEVDYFNNQAQGKLWLQQGSWQDIDLANADASFHYQPDRVDARLNVASGVYSEAEIQTLHTDIVYTPQALYLKNITARAFAGSLSGNALIGMGKSKALLARMDGRNLELGQIESALKVKIPSDYRPAGRFNLNASVGGSISNPYADASFYSAHLLFPSSQLLNPLDDFQGKIHYTKPLTTLAISTHSNETGQVKMAAILGQLDHLEAKLEARHMPLRFVNHWSPQAYFDSGIASFDASMQGSIKAMQHNWMDFAGTSNLVSRDLNLHLPEGGKDAQGKLTAPVDQHLDQADASLTWNHGLADIQNLVLANNDSRLQGKGKLSVPRLLSPSAREHAFTGSVEGNLDVKDFPILARYDLEAGKIKLALTADTLGQGEIVASLQSSGEQMRYRGVNLERFRLNTDYANRVLKLKEASLVQGNDQFDMMGSVDFKTTSPTLDLTARADDFDLKTLVSLLPPDLRKQIEPGLKDKDLPPPDDLPTSFQLPGINQRQIFRYDLADPLTSLKPEDLVISWEDVFAHWNRYKFEPGNLASKPTPERNQRLFDTLAGELSLDAEIKGTVAKPDLKVQGLIEGLKLQQSEVSESYLSAEMHNQVLHFNQFYLREADGGVLRLTGDLNPDKDVNLELKGEGVQLDLLKPFLSSDMRLNGKLDFSAFVQGATRNPQITAEGNIDRLLLNRYFFDNLKSLITYSEGYLRNTSIELNTGDQQVTASGDVPVMDLNKPMDVNLQLANESFGLLNLFTNTIDWRSGEGSLLVRVLGSPRHPQFEGDIQLNKAEIYIPMLKEALSDFSMKGELTRNPNEFGLVDQNFVISMAKGHYGGGTVQTTGTMDFDPELKPSFFNLVNLMDHVTVNYTQPGLFNTVTPISHARILIAGTVTQPTIKGEIYLDKNGEIYFPFIKEKQNIAAINSVESNATNKNRQNYFFGGLKIVAPYPYHLNSPLFDIPVYSTNGFEMLTRVSQLAMRGDLQADKGKIYLLNNVLNVDKLNVIFGKNMDYDKPIQLNQAGLKADFSMDANFKIPGANDPVIAKISGNLEDLKRNDIKFVFSNNQGLTDTEILSRLLGFGAVGDLAKGDAARVATEFSESLLRGLFDPLTSTISTLLGLEELSFGIAGQSARGPVFKFTVRSSPYSILNTLRSGTLSILDPAIEKNLIEKNLEQLKFLDLIRLRATGYLDEQTTYELGASYRLSDYWGLDYQYKQLESEQTLRFNGSYQLDPVLQWADCLRKNYFGWPDPDPNSLCKKIYAVPDTAASASPQPAPEPGASPSASPDAQPGIQAEPVATTAPAAEPTVQPSAAPTGQPEP